MTCFPQKYFQEMIEERKLVQAVGGTINDTLSNITTLNEYHDYGYTASLSDEEMRGSRRLR